MDINIPISDLCKIKPTYEQVVTAAMNINVPHALSRNPDDALKAYAYRSLLNSIHYLQREVLRLNMELKKSKESH